MENNGKPSLGADASALRSALAIRADHPALPGHFPGQPVVPGVVMLDRVLMAIRGQFPSLSVVGLRRIKFLRRLDPDSVFELVCGSPREGTLAFKCWRGDELLAEGKLLVKDRDH